MKNLIKNVLLSLVGIAIGFLIAKSLGLAIFHFVVAGVLTFAAEWLFVFIAALTGFAPVGTKGGGWSPKITRYIVAALCLVVAFFTGGTAGLIGALVGSFAARFYFRSAL